MSWWVPGAFALALFGCSPERPTSERDVPSVDHTVDWTDPSSDNTVDWTHPSPDNGFDTTDPGIAPEPTPSPSVTPEPTPTLEPTSTPALVAGPAPGPGCGDGACITPETCGTCPADCDACRQVGEAHYVDCSASSNGDGSYERPWNSVAAVNAHAFNPGDDVFFKVGTVCAGAKLDNFLQVNWSGTPSNWVTIGAYHGRNAFGLGGNARPKLDGEMRYPTVDFRALVSLTINGNGPQTDAYIEVKDLEMTRSTWYGVGTKHRRHFRVDNNHVHHTSGSCITVFRSAYGEITNNVCAFNSWNNNANHASLPVGGIDDLTLSHDNLVAGNIVTGGREGIGAYKGNSRLIIEKNIVYDQYKGGTDNVPTIGGYYIYIDAGNDITVRYNLVYLSTASKVGAGSAIQATMESARCAIKPERYAGYHLDGIEIYGNLIANMATGVKIGIQGACQATNSVSNTKIHNNTIVGCDHGIKWEQDVNDGQNNRVHNNIIWRAGGNGKPVGGDPAEGSWRFAGNLYDVDPGAPFNAKAIIADPMLVKRSGWSSIGPGSLTGEEFALTASSPAIDKAVPLEGYDSRITSSHFAGSQLSVVIEADNPPDIGAWMHRGDR